MGRHAKPLIDAYLAELDDARYSANTLKAYRRWITDYAEHLRRRHLGVLSAKHPDVVAWRRTIEGKPATVRLALSSVRGFHAYLHAIGVAPIDPTRAVRSPRRGDDESVKFSHPTGAIDALHDAIREPFDAAILSLIYWCALRISEAATLPRAHVSLGDARMCVIGKGRKRRDLWIPDQAVDMLLPWFRAHPDATHALPARGRSTLPHVSCVTIDRRLRALGVRAGIDPDTCNAHSFRHARAEHLRAQGIDVVWTAGYLGHEDVDMTAHYMNPPTANAPTVAA